MVEDCPFFHPIVSLLSQILLFFSSHLGLPTLFPLLSLKLSSVIALNRFLRGFLMTSQTLNIFHSWFLSFLGLLICPFVVWTITESHHFLPPSSPNSLLSIIFISQSSFLFNNNHSFRPWLQFTLLPFLFHFLWSLQPPDSFYQLLRPLSSSLFIPL